MCLAWCRDKKGEKKDAQSKRKRCALSCCLLWAALHTILPDFPHEADVLSWALVIVLSPCLCICRHKRDSEDEDLRQSHSKKKKKKKRRSKGD